jgi:hypothetical protein
MTSTTAICAHEHSLMQTGTKKINRNERSTNVHISITQLLTEQQLFPAQRTVAMSGNSVAYDATNEHIR